MKKLIIILTCLSMMSCGPMSAEQRQAWRDFDLRAKSFFNATGAVANVAGAYTNVRNAESNARISRGVSRISKK